MKQLICDLCGNPINTQTQVQNTARRVDHIPLSYTGKSIVLAVSQKILGVNGSAEDVCASCLDGVINEVASTPMGVAAVAKVSKG